MSNKKAIKRIEKLDVNKLLDFCIKDPKQFFKYSNEIMEKITSTALINYNKLDKFIELLDSSKVEIIVKKKAITLLEWLLLSSNIDIRYITKLISEYSNNDLEDIIYYSLEYNYYNLYKFILLKLEYIPRDINKVWNYYNLNIYNFYVNNKNIIKNKLNYKNYVKMLKITNDSECDFSHFTEDEIFSCVKRYDYLYFENILKCIKTNESIVKFLKLIICWNTPNRNRIINNISFNYNIDYSRIKINKKKYYLYLYRLIKYTQFELLQIIMFKLSIQLKIDVNIFKEI